MASLEVPSSGEGIPLLQEDTHRKRAKEIIALELQLCRRLGMRIQDIDAPDTHGSIDAKLHRENLVPDGLTHKQVYPGLFENVLSPPDTEPKAPIISLRQPQYTTPLPRHSNPE
jgi:hypothetical protein